MLLNSLDLHQTQIKIFDLWLTLRSYFTFLKLCKYSQIMHLSPRVASTPNRTKTHRPCLSIYKYSTHTKSRHLTRGKSEEKFPNSQVLQQKILDLTSLFSLINTRTIKVGWQDAPLAFQDFSQIKKQKVRFHLALNKTFCPTPLLLSHQ